MDAAATAGAPGTALQRPLALVLSGGGAQSPRCIPSLLDRANLVTRIHQREAARALAAAHGVAMVVIEVAGRGGKVLDFRAAAPGLAFGRDEAARWLQRVGSSGTGPDLAVPGAAGYASAAVGRPL